MTKNATSYNSTEQQKFQKNDEVSSNEQETISSTGSRTDSYDVQNNEKTSGETTQGSDYEEPNVLKRKASTSSLTEAKRKRSIEEQVLEESVLDLEDPKEKIKNLMFHVDALKAECMWKDNQMEKLKIELDEKVEEIKKLLAINSRYKSGLACIICTGYLANPCTINCGHSFCYSCLREWLKTNRENGSKCPSCRAEITAQPILSYVLKDQVEALVEQLLPEEKKGVLETLEKEDQLYKQISDHWAGIFDQSIRPLLDEEDGVLRCPSCGWEVEDSICGNCNQHIDIGNRNDDSGDDDDNEEDNSDIDNWGNESDTYDSDDSFIDDGSDNLVGNNESQVIDLFVNSANDNYDDGYLVANESHVILENEDEPPLNRPFNAIIINDSSSELSEEQSGCDNAKGNFIVISSDDGEEKSSNRSQPTSPLSNSPYDPSDDEPFRVRLNTRRMSTSLDHDDESQEQTRSFSIEAEYAERNSDIPDSDGSHQIHL
ncbi:hypothetical protein C1645_881549 [Glomus cerebriforme]|uniref:RING-type domain-containing protein n=1 Tax=Glomus cerebriforme TaxID=658196 RepID=A0A397SC20_9GLOM|nr:hypothetical protein C1645_881549 [Glomus cerebriforme]